MVRGKSGTFGNNGNVFSVTYEASTRGKASIPTSRPTECKSLIYYQLLSTQQRKLAAELPVQAGEEHLKEADRASEKRGRAPGEDAGRRSFR